MAGVVDLGDLPVAFRAVDRERAAAITRLLGGLEARSVPARAEIRYQRRRPATPRRRPSHAYPRVRVWHRDDELVVQFDDEPAGARATPDAVWIGGPSHDLDRVFRQLFHFSVTHLLAHHHRYVLHAAGLVTTEGNAYVVVGATGQGKSTLALAAVASGWGLLADDLVVIRRCERGLEASGIARSVAVPGDLGDVLPVSAPPIPGDERGRRDLGFECLTKGWFPVAGVIVVGHSASTDGDLEPLAGEPTLYRVLGAFSSATDPRLLTQFFPIAAAMSRLPSLSLGHGVDAATRLATACRFLAELSAPRSPRRARLH
jgi:hypothetical protein